MVLNRRHFILHTGAAAAVGVWSTPAVWAQAAPAGRTVLVVGDSLSAEYGLKRGEGWVALLEQRLNDLENRPATTPGSEEQQ